jgi:diguanylate cyclase
MRRALSFFGEYRDRQMITFAGVLGIAVAVAMMGIIDAYSVSPSAVSLTLAAVVGAFGICIVGSMSAWRIRQKLSEQNLRFDVALNNMNQGLCMFDAQGLMAVWNERYRQMYNIDPRRIWRGCTVRDLLDARIAAGTFPLDPERYDADLRAALKQGKAFTLNAELKDGRTIAVVNQPMPGGGWVATHEDVSERIRADRELERTRSFLKRHEQRIEHLAHHDTLTDLPNRAAFNECIVSTIGLASVSNESFALLCLDLDRFKTVNDVFGHAVGDALLREVAGRLHAACQGAFFARLGGDEFAVITPTGGAQPAAAETLAERLSAALDSDIEISGNMLHVGLTIGVGIYPQDGIDAATLVANTDAALFRAKSEMRGSIRFFEISMDKQLREKRALQQDLRSAISRGELELHYQPQARIDGDITGFEALMRWHHPRHGLVAPGTFIPLAEESGHILGLGEWILRTACREAAFWPRPLRIAINLSPVQFQQGDLPRLVHQILLETGLSPSRLELEITEGVLIGDFARAVSILRRLKGLGVRIAMDDFGTGYSSLSYLQSFPFDKIKIGEAFVANLSHSQQASTIIRAVIALGRGLNLPVVAEGVETEEQLRFLASENCNEIQGYFVGRPKPIEDYAEVVGRVQSPRRLGRRTLAAAG